MGCAVPCASCPTVYAAVVEKLRLVIDLIKIRQPVSLAEVQVQRLESSPLGVCLHGVNIFMLALSPTCSRRYHFILAACY